MDQRVSQSGRKYVQQNVREDAVNVFDDDCSFNRSIEHRIEEYRVD